MKYSAAIWCVLTVSASAAFGANSHYPDSKKPLKDEPFTALPLGSVRANGWLLKQLEMQREGLTGHAEAALTELDHTSAWLGGDKDNWERSPYYVKGLIALAYTLDDAELKERAQKWVDWALSSQRKDGYYGPANNDDWWPRMVSNYFLRDYHEATGDTRVLPFLANYYRYMLATLPHRPLKDWGKSRAGDEMDTVIWLYNRTGEPFLLELVDLLRKQAYDWPSIMHNNAFMSFGKDFQPRHNVNIPQAMKMPAVSWLRSGDERDRNAIDAGFAHLMREHGLSVGMQSGTEFLAGRSPAQGIEFCSIVEQMLSDETIVRIVGDGKYSDRLEQLAYNALPAAWNRALTGLRYYTLPNCVIAKRGPHGFGQDYHNGIVFGPRSGFPCCCFNVHQGWPKFVQNSWAATSDDGLAAIAYAPTTVTAKVGEGAGATAIIVEETRYPFLDEIRFKITMSAPTKFPLTLRTPTWCEKASITVNGEKTDAPKPGTFSKISREWKTGDEVLVKLPMAVRIQRGIHDSASIHRGPLLFSLKIDDTRKVVGEPARGFHEIEQTPRGAWNYALLLNDKSPGVLTSNDPPSKANEFSSEHTPVRMFATVRKLPQWTLAWNGVVAFDPPQSPVQSKEPEERVELVPFGATDLRVTDFPVVGEAGDAKPKAASFTFDSNEITGWSWFGGCWYAREGKLRTSNTDGVPGFKALIEAEVYTDVRIQADVDPPPKGDAGVIFHVSKPGIGADSYEGYYAGVSASENQVILGRADGRWSPLKIVDRQIARDLATKLTVVARGDRIEVTVGNDAKPVISLTDDGFPSGQVGVRMYTSDKDNAVAAFDNVRITPLPASP